MFCGEESSLPYFSGLVGLQKRISAIFLFFFSLFLFLFYAPQQRKQDRNILIFSPKNQRANTGPVLTHRGCGLSRSAFCLSVTLALLQSFASCSSVSIQGRPSCDFLPTTARKDSVTPRSDRAAPPRQYLVDSTFWYLGS